MRSLGHFFLFYRDYCLDSIMCRTDSVLCFTQYLRTNNETGNKGKSILWDVGTRRRNPDDSSLNKRNAC